MTTVRNEKKTIIHSIEELRVWFMIWRWIDLYHFHPDGLWMMCCRQLTLLEQPPFTIEFSGRQKHM